MATIVDAVRLSIVAGASFAETITWSVSGELVPLPVGTTAEIKVRPSLYDETVILRFSTSPVAMDGLIVLTTPGVIALSLTPTQTAPLEAITEAVFDMKFTFPDGRIAVKLDQGKGRVTIRTAVTRP